MRFVNVLFVLGALAASAGAAHIFFKAGDIDALEQKHALTQAEIDQNLKRAETGDVRAQYRVAELYRTASPPLQNFAKALSWHRKSAERGNSLSQYVLGQMYGNGQGVRQNFHRAAEWYRLATRLSRHSEAQFSLGELYFHGRGVPSSYGLAIEWYTKAANQGHPVAQYFLGQINKEGWGVSQNLIEGYKWLLLANKQASRVVAHNDRNDPMRALKAVKALMNSSQIKAGDKAFKEWKPKR